MIKKLLFTIISILPALTTKAQITIDGHQPFYDKTTKTLLYVTSPSTAGNLSADIAFADGNRWKNIKIDGKSINKSHTTFYFGDVTSDNSFSLTATEDGVATSYYIHFSTLPVLSISKEDAFTNDYGEATIAMDTPDSGFVSSCKVKHRGGSSNTAGRHKRNYKIKLTDDNGQNKDMQILGMRSDNVWILDAGQIDHFRLRNSLLHKLWLDFSTKPYYSADEPKTVNGCHTYAIELFVNNEYRGIYSIMEPVDRKQLKLKKYNSSQGGVRGLLYKSFSWDGTKLDSLVTRPYDNTAEQWAGWEIKYPKPADDADTTDYKPLQDFERFIVGANDDDFRNGIDDKLDVPVFIDYTLLVQMVNAFDNFGKNMFWSVYDITKESTSKVVTTPWDLDATMGQHWKTEISPVDTFATRPTRDLGYITGIDRRLAEVLGEEYTEKVEGRYASLRETYFSYDSLTARFEQAYDRLTDSGAAMRETRKWSGDSDIGGYQIDFGKELDYIKSWIKARLRFLDNKYSYTDMAGTGIKTIGTDMTKHQNPDGIYNLQGQKVSGNYRGIIIKNGRKYIKR